MTLSFLLGCLSRTATNGRKMFGKRENSEFDMRTEVYPVDIFGQ